MLSVIGIHCIKNITYPWKLSTFWSSVLHPWFTCRWILLLFYIQRALRNELKNAVTNDRPPVAHSLWGTQYTAGFRAPLHCPPPHLCTLKTKHAFLSSEEFFLNTTVVTFYGKWSLFFGSNQTNVKKKKKKAGDVAHLVECSSNIA